MVRTNSMPRPRKVLMVTKEMKKEDMRGSEFPSISKAASGVSTMMAIVSKMEPAIVVTKNTLTTWNRKYLENALIWTSENEISPSNLPIAMKRGGKSCCKATIHIGCTIAIAEENNAVA